MASSGGSSGAAPSLERVIGEAFCKAASVILESRIYRPRPPKAQQEDGKGRAWFNLEVEEVEGASKALERWRRETGLPLVLEVFLQPWGASQGGQAKVETLLERWVVHYYPMLPEGPSHLSRSQLSRLNPSSVYKRLVITLRSLYTYVRLLPAYRMYRACKRQRGSNFSLGYRLHSTLPGAAATAAPGARRMQSFKFGAVDTPYGQLRISVDYQPASTVTILEQTTSPPPLPQIIAEYVGSPAAGRGSPLALRHAMSASAAGWAQGPSPPTPTHSQRQQHWAVLPQAVQPGSTPHSMPGRAGGLPIRRSWSTSMRAASPHRTLSQPSSELPSPVSARDMPYGSAPQQPMPLPAMLRALSMPSGKHMVGSPSTSGKPPLAKPPRSSTAPLAASPGAGHSGTRRPSPAVGSPLSAGGLGVAVEAETESEEGAEGESGSPCSSGTRQSSAPVSIPGRGADEFSGRGRGPAAGRRLRSSGDLWALQQAARMHKPLSAPAVSHMQAAQEAAAGAPSSAAAARVPGAAGSTRDAGRQRALGEGRTLNEPSPSPPAPARLPPIPGLESESSGSAASSLYPTSCSPQLPFAFTPSAQSLGSFGTRGPLQDSGRLERVSPRLGRTLSNTNAGSTLPSPALQPPQLRGAGSGGAVSSSGGAGFSPGSGGVTGREVPASTALMRRPSWSSRSSAFNQLAGEGSQPGVGYSVSPMQDPGLESLLAGSTPRQFTLTGGLPSPLSTGPLAGSPVVLGGSLPLSRVGSTASGSGFGAPPPMLTFPQTISPELSGALDEADVLPFALDEASSASPIRLRSPAPASPVLPPSAAATVEQPPISVPAGGGSAPRADPQTMTPAADSAALRGSTPGNAAAAAGAVGPAQPVPTPPVDTDAAVGAFVRLIQEAPPLRMHTPRLGARAASADLSMSAASLRAAPPGTSSGSDSSGATCLSDGRGLTLQAGLRQFSRIKERLQQRGVLVGAPAHAEA